MMPIERTRSGDLGAVKLGAQRGRIQEESLRCEHLKHTDEYPIIGVNTFRNPHGDPVPQRIELARFTDDRKPEPAQALGCDLTSAGAAIRERRQSIG